MLDPVTVGLGVATGLGNLFGNQSAARQREIALGKYRKKLIEAQYDPVEKAKAIDRVGDAYNTSIADNMNSSAFGLGRFLNSNTAKAVSTSKMLGQRSGAMVDEANRIEGFNKKIDLDIASLELEQPVRDPLGDLIEGGAAGVQLGMSIGNYQSEIEFNSELVGTLKNLNKGGAGLGRYKGKSKRPEDLFRNFSSFSPRGAY